jgi:hypothetical protein
MSFSNEYHRKKRIFVFCVYRLLTRDGALLAYSGFEAKDAKIIAAMASSIFAAHQRVRQTPTAILPQNYVGSGDLNMILLDAEVSLIHYLCHSSVHLGRKNGDCCCSYPTGLYGIKNQCSIRNVKSESKKFSSEKIHFFSSSIYFRWMHLHHIFKNRYVKYPKAITNHNLSIDFCSFVLLYMDPSSGHPSVLFIIS